MMHMQACTYVHHQSKLLCALLHALLFSLLQALLCALLRALLHALLLALLLLLLHARHACGLCGHRCCTYAVHGVAPAPVPSAAAAAACLGMCAPYAPVCANQHTPPHVEQQMSIEDSNSGKLCMTMYIINTETRNRRARAIEVSFSMATQLISMILLRAPPGHPSTNSLMELFCRQVCRDSGWGNAPCEPCRPSSAQLPDKEASRHYVQGPVYPPDVKWLAEEVCLACMPGFRAGGTLGGPG
eukprot:1158129-Pelagomonas_calceolata.AAC.13